jgi:hypothetical protein
MANEHKHLKVFIDEAIAHRNKNNHGELNRLELGRAIMPDAAEGYINNTMANWNAGKLIPQPDAWQIKFMAIICGVSVDFLLGVTDMPEPYKNFPANMFTVLLLAEKKLQGHYNTDECEVLQKIQELKNEHV